jgi:hypothetical protein
VGYGELSGARLINGSLKQRYLFVSFRFVSSDLDARFLRTVVSFPRGDKRKEPSVRAVPTEGQSSEKPEQAQAEPNGSQEEIKDNGKKKKEPGNLAYFFVGSDSARDVPCAAVLIEWHPSSGFSRTATNWTVP